MRPHVKNQAESEAAYPAAQVSGDPYAWRVIAKFSVRGMMKSTKGMNVPGGVLISVSTEHTSLRGNVTACSDALTFVPDVMLQVGTDGTATLSRAYD